MTSRVDVPTDDRTTTVIGPLNFSKEITTERPSMCLANDESVRCMFCDRTYNFRCANGQDQYLGHLYLVHRLVIADVKDIECLASYSNYWQEKFADGSMEKYCSVMLLNQLPDGKASSNEKYYLLSDVEPLDYELRHKLRRDKVDLVLARHQFERIDRSFDRQCLYCRDFCSETRAGYVEHLYTKHFLQLGKPENLVFVDELVDAIEHKMKLLICLFCEKVFKDRPTLKEHMRKKGHKRINPDNRFYDRFFLVNYKSDRLRKPDATAKPIAPVEAESDALLLSDGSDSDWSDWNGEEQETTCLFCPLADAQIDRIKAHMVADHDFDFDDTVTGMSFYQRVKVVNFIRRQIHIRKCIFCGEELTNFALLSEHLSARRHYRLSSAKVWDQPEYFFPTYEDDQFLCHLEDEGLEEEIAAEKDESVIVVSENLNVGVNKEAELLSLENIALD